MKKTALTDRIRLPTVGQVLVSFTIPRTPGQAQRRLAIKKLKMKPFVEKGLIRPLNPTARKGRLYIVTCMGRRLLGLPSSGQKIGKPWNVIGWIMASAGQRLVILQAMDSAKRTSENIRERASRSNPHLSRISTKGILKDLVDRGLVKTEIQGRKRYFWLSKKGKSIVEDLDRITKNRG